MVYYTPMSDEKSEEHRLILAHMEAVVVRLGAADLRCEAYRRRAAAETNPRLRKELEDAAAVATQQLEAIASQVIELGRALASRPDFPLPPFPHEIPQTVRESAASEYEGRAAMPPETTIVLGSRPPRGEA